MQVIHINDFHAHFQETSVTTSRCRADVGTRCRQSFWKHPNQDRIQNSADCANKKLSLLLFLTFTFPRSLKSRIAPTALVEWRESTRDRKRSGRRILRRFSSMLETSIRFQKEPTLWHFWDSGNRLVHKAEVRSNGGVRQPAQLHGHGSWKPWLWWLCRRLCALRWAGGGLWKMFILPNPGQLSAAWSQHQLQPAQLHREQPLQQGETSHWSSPEMAPDDPTITSN